MKVVTSKSSVEIPRSEVVKYYFNEATTSVQDFVDSDVMVSNISDNTIVFKGLPDNTHVRVFTTNGQCVANKVSGNDGYLLINNPESGIYIISYNNNTFKYLVK